MGIEIRRCRLGFYPVAWQVVRFRVVSDIHLSFTISSGQGMEQPLLDLLHADLMAFFKHSYQFVFLPQSSLH